MYSLQKLQNVRNYLINYNINVRSRDIGRMGGLLGGGIHYPAAENTRTRETIVSNTYYRFNSVYWLVFFHTITECNLY